MTGPRSSTTLPRLAASTFALALAGWASAPAFALSLEEAVQITVASNPEVGVRRANRLAVEQDLRFARSQLLPSLDLQASAGPEYFAIERNPGSDFPQTDRENNTDASTLFRAQAGLTLTQLLFDGFATQSEIARQEARLDSSAYRVAATSEFTGLDAVQAYLDVLRYALIVEAARDNVERHRRILGQIRDLTEQGRSNIADVRQTEARLARAVDDLVSFRGNLADTRATFLRVVGREPTALSPSAPPLGFLPTSGEEAAAVAEEDGPIVRATRSDVDVARAELRASRAGYYPSFDLQAQTNTNRNPGGNENTSVAASALVVMRYNLFRGGGDVARERGAFYRVEQAVRQLEVDRRDSAETARQAYNAFLTARDRTTALRAQVEANRLTREAYGEQFQLGQRGLLDVLDSENDLFLARAGLVTAETTEDFSVYNVLATVGRMLDALEVETPPEAVTIDRRPIEGFPVFAASGTEPRPSPAASPPAAASPVPLPKPRVRTRRAELGPPPG